MDYSRLKMIVCLGKDGLLGDQVAEGNGLLWHSKEELQYYKAMTTGNVTLFGKNTAQYVPLNLMRKTREVIVLSQEMKIEDILAAHPDKDVFVCGGATIYKYYLEHYPISQIYVSKLKEHVKVAEAKHPLYFPDIEAMGYRLTSEKDYEDFTACVYEQK